MKKRFLYFLFILKHFILFAFLFLAPINSNADYLLANKNICISDYWYGTETSTFSTDDYFYYIKSSDPDTTYKTTSDSYQQYIYSGFDYNSSDDSCSAPKIVKDLSMNPADYNFVMAFLGLLLGFSFLFAVLNVFGRK